jgi:acetate---CoA ligase (ADP-forming)
MRDLARLLRPRSVAVVGGGAWAANVVEQCARMGFTGPVWPVNPTRATIGGQPCLPALAALPAAPDAVFVGVNRHATVRTVAELAQMGAGGAVCFAAGWAEAGEGALQAELVAAAGSMPILGPNCYGLINYLDGALLWPDQHGGRRIDRGVALISQSSNIAINLTMQRRALPVGYVACLGNAAQTGLAELGGALLADPRVTALGLYLEGVGDAAAFAAMAETAARAGKAIVALKSGKSEGARAAAASHTASLAGGGAASTAFLARCGVAEVATLPELLEALKIAHVHGPGGYPRLCAVACSGGEAGLAADLAAARGLTLDPPTEAQRTRLGVTLGPLVTIANPLDYHTFIWGDGPRTAVVFTDMLAGYDAGLYIIDPPRPDRCDPSSFGPALAAIETAQAATARPAFAVASIPENLDEALAEGLMERGCVPLMGLDTALGALAALDRASPAPDWRPWPARAPTTAQMLDEAQSKALLRSAGLAIPRGTTAPDLAHLVPETLSAPFALKGLGFAHKTEAGAVRLNLTSLGGQSPIPGATGYLLEEMVQDARAELLLGLRRDPVYGATLTLGMGGTLAELLADTVTLICPADQGTIEAALRRLRLWPLLDGHRGRPRPALGPAIAAALVLQNLLQDDPTLVEIEVNPLILTETQAIAADAVIWRETPCST